MADIDRLPYKIQQQLNAVRSTLRGYVAIRSLLLVVLWLLLAFWLGGLVDYLPVRVGANETPRWLRVGLLAAMGLGSVWILLRWFAPLWLSPIADRSLALLIERHRPDFNSELVTTVELTGKDESEVSNPALHRAMLERVRTSAGNKAASLNPTDLFNWQPVWALGTACAMGLVMTIIAAVGIPGWMGQWSSRLFGLSNTPWPRSAELRADGVQLVFPSFSGQLSAERVMIPFETGMVHVPEGAAVMFQISANANAKRVPEVCTLYYLSGDGTRGRANLRRVGSPRDGWQQFTLDGSPFDGINNDLELSVVGLDARLRDLQIQVVEPAVIANMQLQCVYPPYLLDDLSSRPPQESLPYRAGLRIPEGTHVTLAGVANTELNQVQYQLLRSEAKSEDAGEGAVDNAPKVIKPSGKQFAIELGVLRNNQVVEIRLLDQFGLPSEQIMRYVITIVEDEPPDVESTLAGIGSAVTPIALLPIRGKVVDDNQIAEVYLEMAVNEFDPRKLPLEVDRDGQLQSTIDLRKLIEAGWPIAPDASLGLVVAASDRFDLDGQPHVGRGQPQQLAVVTPDKLLVLLDRQELELRQRLEIIMEELRQVDEALKSLDTLLSPTADETAQALPAATHPTQFTALFQPPDSAADADALDRPEQDAEEEAARARRLAVLRAQQSMLQCDKSQQELLGVANRIENVRLQLLNNRIDSYDRQERLQTKVHEPLIQLMNNQYRDFSRNLVELQTAAMSGRGREPAQAALQALSQVLDGLEQIKANMLDIESFNEIVDLVRGMLEDQERILNETEAKRKSGILDLLK